MIGTWLACGFPERPTDARVEWHYSGCPGCAIRIGALARLYPDDASVLALRDKIVGSDAEG